MPFSAKLYAISIFGMLTLLLARALTAQEESTPQPPETTVEPAEMEEAPDSVEASPTPGEEAAAPEQDVTLFGEEFLLDAPGGSIDFEVEGNVVTFLDARGDVTLRMTDLRITCVRLLYSEQTKILRAYGDESQRCVVQQRGLLTFCQRFVYNTETGEADFIGAPQMRVAEEAERSIEAFGEELSLTQGERGSRLLVGRKPIVKRDFEAPGVTTLDYSGARNPTIVLGPPTGVRQEGPEDVLRPGILRKRTPRVLSVITPESVGLVSDNSTVEIGEIEPAPPLAGERDEKDTGRSFF